MPDEFLQNISPREYQKTIYETCRGKNTLVVLPTGIGKTLIALMLTVERMKRYPGEKVLFLAPTKPLAEQHLEYFKKHLTELFGDMQLFTGAVNASSRKKIWQNADIIFSTPQCIANDVKNGLYELSGVCLLIEDEAHRCMKNYDYNYVAQTYTIQALHPRIIGLTASPGSEAGKIKQICKNLSIEAVELRTRQSADVSKYLQELDFEKVMVNFPPEFEEMRHILKKLFAEYVEELKVRNVLYGPINKISLIELQRKIMASLARGNKNFNYMLAASACAQAIKLQHALELLETQTLSSFNKYLKGLYEQASKKQSKGVVKLVAKPEFNFIFMQSNELLAKGMEHPKANALLEIISKEKANNEKQKTIIFTQYRETASMISKLLNSLPHIKAKIFVGQTKKSGSSGNTGLSQKEQKSIIQEFSSGEINCLVATSIHPDEYIVLRKKNQIMIKKIGDFVDFFIQEEGSKSNSREIFNWQALTSDGNRLLFKPITRVHKHPLQNNILKLKLSSGFECSVTENHSLFSFNNKKRFIPSAPRLTKFVALALKAPNVEQNRKIDVIKEIIDNCQKEALSELFGSVNNLSQGKMRILKTDFNILSRLNKRTLNITELSKLTERDYSTTTGCLKRLENDGLVTTKRVQKNYKKFSEITNDGLKYLRFLKWFFGNVSYGKGKYKFKLIGVNSSAFNDFFQQHINVNHGKTNFPRFINLNEQLAMFLGFYVSEGSARKTKSTSDVFLAARKKEMQELMKKSIEKGLNLKTRTNWRGVAIDSQIAYYLIKYIFRAGIGAYNKEVPEMIFTAPSNIKWKFLKAYILGDGHIGKNRIVLTTVSRKLVIGLVLLLRMLGITKITLNQQKNIYRINIHESLPFAEVNEKNEKRRRAYFSLIPTALNSKKVFKQYKNFYSPQFSGIKSRKNGKWKGDICFDYIKKIEKIEKPKFVYDLSVKDTENFIGGTGLLCLHNSIGEEGLDIPEVNAVIFYEPVPSAIRAIQRAGRTARLMPGKLKILITKGTRDEGSYYASRAREKQMHKSISSIKDRLENPKKIERQGKL